MRAWRSVPGLALLLAPAPLAAHVVAQPREAVVGSYQVVRFQVGHGCKAAATTAVRIEIPPQVLSAHPQPKAGWTLTIERAPDHPSPVTAITWSGLLPTDQFEEFAVQFKLPTTPGTLYFPAVQSCGPIEAQWTGVPDSDDPPGALEAPAPALRLLPAPGSPDSGHHH